MIQGPFRINPHLTIAWEILGADGVSVAEITGQLIDGSGRKHLYPDGVIRTREARKAEAHWILEAMNEKWQREQVVKAVGLALEQAYPFGYRSEDGP